MLSIEENERLTQVGPGTPMGALMRRYWHPVAAVAQLEKEPTKEIRILGEDLILYKDRSGRYGLIGKFCAHRRVNLAYGIPEEHGLRCMYHGWLYNESGQCMEQPFEDTVRPEGKFKEKIQLPSYPIEQLGGLLFAYLGPKPAPLLPRWDIFTWDNTVREIGSTHLPCNWLQCMENSADPVHTEWLHGRFFAQVLERQGLERERPLYWQKHIKIGFDLFDYGLIKRRVLEGRTEEDDDWKVGHPVLFPNILRLGGAGIYEQHYRVPMDDHNTMHWAYEVFAPGNDVPSQTSVPYYDIPLRFEDGRLVDDTIDAQDTLAWVIQGKVMDRSLERLGESDKGVILYRQMLQEQMKVVEDGGEPMCVFRDPTRNTVLSLPTEENKMGSGHTFSKTIFEATHARYSPNLAWIQSLFEDAANSDSIEQSSP